MMSSFAVRLHSRLGDFWWYSLMMFAACRAADLLNAFVGLWLVPKFIDPAELGAVLPLTSFATSLALPVYIFAMTFMKEVNSLATRREFGQMKTFMRGVFAWCGVFLVLAVVLTRLTLPLFLEKMRVAEGSLGLVIIASAFVGCVAPVYSNALQALKRFRTLSVLGVFGAPVRLVTMLVAMPYRALTGYFVGQAASPAFSIVASLFCLRRELSVPAAPYWSRKVLKRLGRLFLGIAAYQFAAMITGLVEQTVLRDRLPALDSAAYYMVTRFSDIANFLSTTLLVTLFPYTAELAERGESTRPLVLKSSLAMIAFAGALAAFFALFGRQLLGLLPHGAEYAPYYWAIPWMIGVSALMSLQNFHTNTEVSAGRFGFLRWWVPFNVAYPIILAYLPIGSLPALLGCFTLAALLKLAFCAFDLTRQR